MWFFWETMSLCFRMQRSAWLMDSRTCVSLRSGGVCLHALFALGTGHYSMAPSIWHSWVGVCVA